MMPKLINTLFALLIFFISELTFTQQPTLQWARTYNGSANQADRGVAIVVDDSGFVYVTGTLKGTLTNDFDYCTIKYTPIGDTSWVRIYSRVPGDSLDVARDLKVDLAGNVYVTGSPATIKYDRFGNIVWTVTSTTFLGIKLDFDSTGNIYVGGTSINKFTLKKYTNTGILLWSTIYDDAGGGTAKDMVLDKFGNIILVGEMAYNNGNSYDFLTVKFNASGDTIWARSFNGPGSFPPYDWANAVAVDDTGNVYVTGLSNSINSTDYLTFKYDPNGQEIWMKRYTGGIAYDIEVDKSGNAFVAGVTGLSNYTTLKYDYLGNLLWSMTTSGNSFATNVALVLDSVSNVYVAHSKTRNSWDDLAIVKYRSNGTQDWIIQYPGNGIGFHYPNDIDLDGSGNIFVAGTGYGPGQYDFLTLKYSQPIGIETISNETPDGFKLYQNFPNPFNPNTIIRFQIPSLTDGQANSSDLELIIYDIHGREIEKLVNQNLKPGVYEIEWEASGYSSGVYFYQLVSGSIVIETKKMVLLK